MKPYPAWMLPIFDGFVLAFSVRIAGKPHGKGSVRVIPLKNDPKGRKAKGVQAPTSRKYEKRIAELAAGQAPRHPRAVFPLDGPLLLRAIVVIKRPKKKLPWAIPLDPSEPNGRVFCPRTPDWDNLGKSFGDGLKKGKIFTDDARIADGRVLTVYGRPGEKPFAEIYLFVHESQLSSSL